MAPASWDLSLLLTPWLIPLGPAGLPAASTRGLSCPRAITPDVPFILSPGVRTCHPLLHSDVSLPNERRLTTQFKLQPVPQLACSSFPCPFVHCAGTF